MVTIRRSNVTVEMFEEGLTIYIVARKISRRSGASD